MCGWFSAQPKGKGGDSDDAKPLAVVPVVAGVGGNRSTTVTEKDGPPFAEGGPFGCCWFCRKRGVQGVEWGMEAGELVATCATCGGRI